MLAGQETLGGALSMIVILNEQLRLTRAALTGAELACTFARGAIAPASPVVQVTTVVPTAKNDPEGGTQSGEVQEPNVVGANVTDAPHAVAVGEVNLSKSEGQLIPPQPAAAVTVTHPENSEVLFEESVAVAVTTLPTGTLTGKLTLMGVTQPAGGVETVVAPMKV